MPTISLILLSAALPILLTASSIAQLVTASDLNFARTDYTTGAGPYAVGVGDFNGDGIDDLAVANEVAGSVSILLGNGDGTFQPHVDYRTGPGANSVTVADVNGDGRLDLVVTNGGAPSTVSVLLGTGTGTFLKARDYTVGNYAYSPVVGDFNNDGKMDIMVTNFSDSTFSFLAGNGDGTFQAPQTIHARHQTNALAAGDFNNDGILDLAGPDGDDNVVTVYLGKGNGQFEKGVDYTGGSQPVGIAVGDFNGDGIPDLAVVNVCGDNDPLCINGTPGTTSIFLGNGNGTFQPKQDFTAGYDSLSIALNDFNGDGKLDVAVANGCNECNGAPGSVTVQLGNGDGTLQPAKSFTVGYLPVGVATGHFDGSGQGSADIAVANLNSYVGDTVSVLLNDSATLISLTSSPNPSNEGQPVTFTVQVRAAVASAGTPTGSVTFYEGSTALASGDLNNGILSLAISSLPEGTDSITASYTGSLTFNPNTSAPLRQVVK